MSDEIIKIAQNHKNYLDQSCTMVNNLNQEQDISLADINQLFDFLLQDSNQNVLNRSFADFLIQIKQLMINFNLNSNQRLDQSDLTVSKIKSQSELPKQEFNSIQNENMNLKKAVFLLIAICFMLLCLLIF